MIDKMKQVYHMLEDEQSKDTYMAQLNYLFTEDFRYLETMIKKYMPQVLVPYDVLMSDFIRSLPKNKKIILYGTGGDGRDHLHYFKNDKRFIGFCSKNIEKQKDGLEGYPVINLEQLLQMDDVSVVISTHRAREEVKENLKRANFPENNIYELPRNYVWVSIEERVFNDRDLGTSIELTKSGIKMKKRYGPGSVNKEKDGGSWSAEFGYCETWNELKAHNLSLVTDGGARICKDVETCAETTPIDKVVDDQDRIAVIKLDADCPALELLKGAKKTILRDRPTLAININFEPKDIVEIPMYIKELVSGYKLYMRYYYNGPGGIALYAVMS